MNATCTSGAAAVRRLSDEQLRDISGELRYCDRDWMARQRQRLIQPVYKDDAANAVAVVRQQIQHEIESRQPPRYRPTPPAWER